jgi:hypothetical protein
MGAQGSNMGKRNRHQEGRSMTAVNGVIDGMPNTRESAILAAAAEAVEWRHPIEAVTADGKRATPKVIIYPAEMPQFAEAMDEFLNNPSEYEDGSHIAFIKIIEKCADYQSIPRFLREDCEAIRSDTELATKVPIWMNTAAQVSVGSRDYVLENGPDVMNSSDEDSPKEEHGEALTGMYTEGLKAPVMLSQSEVAHQKAAAAALKSIGFGNLIDSDIPACSSSDFSQSAPTSPAFTRCGSRFDTPDQSDSEQPV